MGELAKGLAYANFRAWVPLKRIPLGSLEFQTWTYFDWGPREYPEPLIMFHSVTGAADVFFQQMLELGARGYRVLSVDVPAYWTVPEFTEAFHLFLDILDFRRVHLYGAGLGGFLAMAYIAQRPERVGSIVLTHSYISTGKIHKPLPQGPSVIRWLPEFVIRHAIMSLLPKGRAELHQALAAEFVIARVQKTSTFHCATRLALMCAKESITHLKIADDHITIIDAVDIDGRAAEEASHEILEAFPKARVAQVKTGGDFLYLSNSEEMNVHLVVHMRRNAASPNPPPRLPPPAHPRIADPLEVRKLKEAAREDHLSPNYKYVKQLQTVKAYCPGADVQMLASAVAAFKGDTDIVQRLIAEGAIRKAWKGPIAPSVLQKLRPADAAVEPSSGLRTERPFREDEQLEQSHDYISRGPTPYHDSCKMMASSKDETEPVDPTSATQQASPQRKAVGPERFAPVDEDDEDNPLLVVAEKALHAAAESSVHRASQPVATPVETEGELAEGRTYQPRVRKEALDEERSRNEMRQLALRATNTPFPSTELLGPAIASMSLGQPASGANEQLTGTSDSQDSRDDPWRRYRNAS